ncbi:MAG: hypothetical protein BMS9Abin26_0574 [Gammaproteobacteria bacterium]|nr:MAG: hypothetical protein BMS9Abin26_0574 [Gammaproteobacteria bacterium]
MTEINQSNDEAAAIKMATLVYILQALGFFNGFTFIAGAIVNYMKKEDAIGTLAESHFRWQLRTFWFGLLWSVVGMLLMIVIIGWFVLIGNALWIIYRIVKGWLRLNEGKPMYVAAT